MILKSDNEKTVYNLIINYSIGKEYNFNILDEFPDPGKYE